MTISEFTNIALTSPIYGYYNRTSVFGPEGDFVTSPEISQMFGESFKRFPKFQKSIRCVHLVETSAELRSVQAKKLLCEEIEYNQNLIQDQKSLNSSVSKFGNIQIKWHNVLDDVELTHRSSVMVMAHEFFDALPIHRFELSQNGWTEILIDIDTPENRIQSTPSGIEYTTPSIQNSAVSSFSGNNFKSPFPEESLDKIKFKFVRTKKSTFNSAAFLANEKYSKLFEVGDSIEISPESAIIVQKLATMINDTNGAGLVVDYGQNYTQGSTFRGVSKHKFVDPLANPGEIDLTADVDFSYLIDNIKPIANAFGPVEQGFFLHEMGIQDRLMQLLNMASTVKTQEELVSTYKRLTDPNSMGRIYKFLAIVPKSVETAPVAMEQKDKK
ncbi:NADH dehydrogenase [ubiquinone] complex I, assembly factor 7 [Smittium mucronatum]|uniref:Protein arginine methyltransferase NDUFAF7 n=1 Tax=Smittium mucronatum TaxID=133383 RepID=A0A1R0H7P3_9FUNG|nr:NADH dehydrogenase [ubiquinone] complex I, assembly factor 7 [Smittium mucronatum]